MAAFLKILPLSANNGGTLERILNWYNSTDAQITALNQPLDIFNELHYSNHEKL